MVAERFKALLEQADRSLDSALVNIHHDPDAALDDALAARLLVASALATLSAMPSLVG